MNAPSPDSKSVHAKSAGDVMSLRERNKEKRKSQIIASAERLVLRGKSTDFSMHELAQEAGTSVKTTYNLIGSKSTVLYSILSKALDKIDKQSMRFADNDVDSI